MKRDKKQTVMRYLKDIKETIRDLIETLRYRSKKNHKTRTRTIRSVTTERLTFRDSHKIGRSPAAIRNLRFKKNLVT